MRENDKIPKISEYLSVREAAEMLNTTEKMIYYYVENERIKAVRAANLLLIPRGEIEHFRQKASGRPRKLVPKWRISSKDNSFLTTSITVHIRPGMQNELLKKFERIRRGGQHDFPGTVARYILGPEQNPDALEILLIWKQGIMPAEDEREQALVAFREMLEDVLDWEGAVYRHDRVYMHT